MSTSDNVSTEYSVPAALIERANEWFPELGFAVVTTDLAGTVTSWNAHATQLFGWEGSETVGRPIAEFLIGTVQRAQSDEIIAQLRLGRPWAGRFAVRRRDSSLMTTEVIDLCMVNELGERVGFVAISREDPSDLARTFHDLAQSRIMAQEFDDIRAEIAREIAARLHDDLSQRSHLLLVRTKEILQSEDMPPAVKKSLESLHDDQEEFVSALQSVWRSLRPPLLDEFGARAALEHLEFVARDGGISDVSVGVDEEIDQLSSALKEVVVLIAQEGIANVISHSHATRCSLSVTVENASVVIEVTDNGVGMTGEEGFGLSVMRDRVRHFGGYLEVISGPNGGCTLLVQIEQTWTSLAPLETLIDPHIMLKAERDETGKIVDFVFTDANDAALTYNQTTRDKLIGSRLVELLPGHRDSGLLDMYANTVETGEPLVLDNFIYPNEIIESDRHYDVRAIKVGDSLSYTWRDVTERVALIESYKMLAENASDIVCLTSTDGLIRWVSPSITRELGYLTTDVIGHYEGEFLHPEDLDVRDESLEVVQNSPRAVFELRLRRRDGEYVWYEATLRNIEDDGVVTARINTLRAIDDEMTTRLALQVAVEDFRLLAENVSDVVYRTDERGTIEWISPSVERVLGWRVQDLVGRSGLDLHAGADRDKMAFWRHQVTLGHSVARLEARYRTSSGSVKWMSINAKPLYGSDGQFVGGAVTLRDIDGEVAARRTLSELTGAAPWHDWNESCEEFLNDLCDTIIRRGNFVFAWYATRDTDNELHSLAAAKGRRTYIDQLDIVATTDDEPSEPTAVALAQQRRVIVNDIAATNAAGPWNTKALESGFLSAISLPVFAHDTFHGAWTIYAGETHAFSAPVVAELDQLAEAVGAQIARYSVRSSSSPRTT